MLIRASRQHADMTPRTAKLALPAVNRSSSSVAVSDGDIRAVDVEPEHYQLIDVDELVAHEAENGREVRSIVDDEEAAPGGCGRRL